MERSQWITLRIRATEETASRQALTQCPFMWNKLHSSYACLSRLAITSADFQLVTALTANKSQPLHGRVSKMCTVSKTSEVHSGNGSFVETCRNLFVFSEIPLKKLLRLNIFWEDIILRQNLPSSVKAVPDGIHPQEENLHTVLINFFPLSGKWERFGNGGWVENALWQASLPYTFLFFQFSFSFNRFLILYILFITDFYVDVVKNGEEE